MSFELTHPQEGGNKKKKDAEYPPKRSRSYILDKWK